VKNNYSLHKRLNNKKIENNIKEEITYGFHILLLFDFVIDFQIKQKNVVNLNDV